MQNLSKLARDAIGKPGKNPRQEAKVITVAPTMKATRAQILEWLEGHGVDKPKGNKRELVELANTRAAEINEKG